MIVRIHKEINSSDRWFEMYDMIPNPKGHPFVNESVCHVQLCKILCAALGDQKRNKNKYLNQGMVLGMKERIWGKKERLSWQNVQSLVSD